MQGFKKISAVNVKQILFNVALQSSVGIIVDDAGVEAGSDGVKLVKAGTPMYGSLLDRDTAFKTSTSSIPAVATATVSGTGITAAAVVAATFSTKVSGASGTYEFTYVLADTEWQLDGTGVTLAQYGITPTGTPADGDKITVAFTAAYNTKPVGVLLHDVDVTDGDNNGSLLIWGFVNINRLDTEVANALLAAESDLEGKIFVCAG